MAAVPRMLPAATPANVSLSPLARCAGSLALAAGALFTLTQAVTLARIALVDQADPLARLALLTDPVYLISGVASFVAFCLILLALVAIYGRNGHTAGRAWALGVCAAVVGTAWSAGNVGWADVFMLPWVVEVAPDVLRARPTSGMYAYGAVAGYLLFTLGWVLFGLLSLRARVFPAAICVAIVIGGVLGYVASPPFGIPFGLALAWLGVWMRRATVVDRTSAEPATAAR